MWLLDIVAKVIGYAVLIGTAAVAIIFIFYFIQHIFLGFQMERTWKQEALHVKGRCNPAKCLFCKEEVK